MVTKLKEVDVVVVGLGWTGSIFALELARAVDRDDVRVIDHRRGTRFADEPLAEGRVVGERRREDLERDGPVEDQLGQLTDARLRRAGDAHPATIPRAARSVMSAGSSPASRRISAVCWPRAGAPRE